MLSKKRNLIIFILVVVILFFVKLNNISSYNEESILDTNSEYRNNINNNIFNNSLPRIDLISLSYSGTFTVTVTLTVITGEDATCKYDTQDVSFNNMGYSMGGNDIQHTGSRSYSQDTSGIYYVLCRDEFGNIMSSSSSISFNADVIESTDSGSSSGRSSGGGGSKLSNINSCKEDWVCDSWSKCNNGFQTRKCFDLDNCRKKSQKPKEFQTCKKSCEEIWQCDSWSICYNDIRRRECYDLNKCGTEELKPNEYEECEFIPECYNSIQDNGEEGIDCGGPCPACKTCFDRIQNQGEEGIDCGDPCRACRRGDITITGKSILIKPAYSPSKTKLPMFIIIIISIVLVIKGFHNFKKLIKKKEKFNIYGKKNIISELKEVYKHA